MTTSHSAAAGSTSQQDPFASDKARRIIDAMRACIGKVGPVNATFDVVAKEAGVSRGLLHYYFGSKERLLIEVIRVEAHERVEAIRAVAPHIGTAEQLMDVIIGHMEEWVRNNPESYALVYELLVVARRNDEIGVAFRDMWRFIDEEMARVLQRLADEGAIDLRGARATDVSLALFSLGHGVAMQILADPDADQTAAQQRVAEAGLFLLGADPTNYVLPRLRGAQG
jgi:AcrR family transcriptional regulator